MSRLSYDTCTKTIIYSRGLANIMSAQNHVSRGRAYSLTILMIISALSAFITPVSAIGPNQNDIGSSGDLPDNMTNTTVIPAIGFGSSYTGTGYLDGSNSDSADYLRFSIPTGYGMAWQLSWQSSNGSSNSSSIDFDLTLYDANQSYVTGSYFSNPEYITTNNTNTFYARLGTNTLCRHNFISIV